MERDLSVNMQNKYGMQTKHGRRCVKNNLTQYSIYILESRVSSKYNRNIHRPSTPEKEVNQKENTVGKIAKRRQIRKSTHARLLSEEVC